MKNALSTSELAELSAAFAYVINHEADDPMTPIDPISYRAPDGDTCLHIAAHKGDARAVALLLQVGLNPNELGDMGSTPLHLASSPEVAAILRASGASSEIINEFGRKPGE